MPFLIEIRVFSASHRTSKTNVIDKLVVADGPGIEILYGHLPRLLECTINLAINFSAVIHENSTAEAGYSSVLDTAPIEVRMTSEECSFDIRTNLYKDKRVIMTK